MNILAIETSSPVLSVALKKRGGRIRRAAVKGYMKHAENLLPAIDRLLKKEKLKIGDIDAFLIDRGPGSFTGLRIGFATLKGFLAVLPKPCYGAFSLDVIAAGITPLIPGIRGGVISYTGNQRGENLSVCLDARRGKLYTRSYRFLKKGWTPAGPARVLTFEEITQELSEGCLLAGDGIPKLDARRFSVLPEKSWYPQAATLIELFEAQSPLLKNLPRPGDLLPAYLRRSEAEERLSERKQHG